MPFFASVPFWFLSGKYAVENSSMVCVPLQIFFSKYPLSLKARMRDWLIDWLISHAWLPLGADRTLIRSKAFLFLYFFKYIIFSRFNFYLISITYMSRSVVAEMSSRLWSIYCCNYFFHVGSRPGLQYFRSLFCGDTWIINEPVKDVSV